MTRQFAQADLFDLPAPAPSIEMQSARATAPERIEARAPESERVHWLVATTRRAGTACGIEVSDYLRVDRLGLCVRGERIRCTHDVYDGTVTCARCLEMKG